MIIDSIKKWFVLAVPTPTDKNRAVQLGCHFEEVTEMQDAIGFPGTDTYSLANFLKNNSLGLASNAIDRTELLDSLADQIVTAIGVAHMFGLDISGALAEVDRSNWSKFVDGVPQFDANGKIAKPATYSPPDLSRFV